MSSTTLRGRIVAALLVLFAVRPALSQAWLPPKDTTTVSIDFQRGLVKKHLPPPEEVDIGHIRWNEAILQIGYSFTDRLAVSASVPYVMSKYHGPDPHPLSSTDNGRSHGTWQDYRFEARYQAMRGEFAIAPFAGVTVPTHDYTYFAHSAAGRDLHETTAGMYFGVADLFAHFRGCGCPTGTYLQSRLAYSWVERVLGLRHDRVEAEVDAGYFVTDQIGVRALTTYSRTIGGIPFDLAWYGNLNDPRYLHHDQLVAARLLNAGVGASYSVSDRFDVYGSALHTFYGRNGHRIHVTASAGVEWSFAPGRSHTR